MELIQYQNANQSYDEIINNFIVRQKEFERVMGDIRSTKDGASFQHYVFVGRRGSGKSTLLRRIEAEIVKDAELSSKYVAVNLGEEQSGIYRLYDLYDYIIRDMNALGYSIDHLDFREYKDDMKEYTKVLHGQIIAALTSKKKKLILLVDNIDRVLYNRGNHDDATLLRELLMNFKEIRIIGASTVMSEHFWKYDMPFYQFFSIKRLEPLSMSEVEKLLNHWSDIKQLPEIKNIMKEHPGKIQSIRMLTDGMPRTMLMFVDMMIYRPKQYGYEYLKGIIDKATPIYQERLGILSPAQRKVLSELAYLWDAATVEELIPKCNMDGKTISALLNQLTQSHYVEKIKGNTKNHLYRLEERFFNLWFNMTQGGPQQRLEAKALTDFLEKWYDSSGLKDLCLEFSDFVKQGSVKKDYAETMAHALLNSNELASDAKQELYLTIKRSGLVEVDTLGYAKKYFKDFDSAIEKAFDEKDYEKALELLFISDIDEGRKYFGIGLCYTYLGNYQQAEKYYLIAIEKGNVVALHNLGLLYTNQSRKDEAEKYFLLAIEKGHDGVFNNLGILYDIQGRTEEAEKYFLLAIQKGDTNALFSLGNLHHIQGRIAEAEKFYLLAVEKSDLDALNNLLLMYYRQANKAQIKKLIQSQKEEFIDLYVTNHHEFACVIFLYLGEIDKYKYLTDYYLSKNSIASEPLLTSLLYHKQINWVYNYFKLKPDTIDLYKPLYYATMTLLGNHEQELLKMPPEIKENVDDILDAIKNIQEFYYGGPI